MGIKLPIVKELLGDFRTKIFLDFFIEIFATEILDLNFKLYNNLPVDYLNQSSRILPMNSLNLIFEIINK